MKFKVLIGCCAILVSGFVATAFAATVGNPTKVNLSEEGAPATTGLLADIVFERELDDDGTELESNIYAAKIGYTVAERVDVFAILGAGDLELSDPIGQLETEMSFLWGIGFTAPLFEFDNGVKIGLSGQYRRSKQDISKLEVSGTDLTSFVEDLLYEDWQVALGIAKEFSWGEPYFGVKYNDVEVSDVSTVSGTTIDEDANSDDVVGVFVGIDFSLTDNLNFLVEGRFIDEEAVSGILSFKF